MGLFNFGKDDGKKSVKNADEIKQHLQEELGDKVKPLTVAFDKGVATLYGFCDNPATREKAVLLVGNLKNVEKVDSDKLKVHPSFQQAQQIKEEELQAKLEEVKETAQAEQSQFYKVQPGDSLSKIAKKFYGDGNKYQFIFEENKEVIKNPDLIYPGQTLRIPPLK